MLKPTIGRVVLFHPELGTARRWDGIQPMAAIICYVTNDRLVNLHVIDHDGYSLPAKSVILVQEGDTKPESRYCVWMPYQMGQAAKTEAAEKRAADFAAIERGTKTVSDAVEAEAAETKSVAAEALA